MAGAMSRGVFVVDDDPDCRTALGEVLEEMGLSPFLFADPGEALAALARTSPRLIVTEIGKVGTADARPFRMLLAAATRAELPVIVFSGWNQAAAAPPRRIPFIVKPDVPVLLEMIRARVGLRPREVAPPMRAGAGAAIGAA